MVWWEQRLPHIWGVEEDYKSNIKVINNIINYNGK